MGRKNGHWRPFHLSRSFPCIPAQTRIWRFSCLSPRLPQWRLLGPSRMGVLVQREALPAPGFPHEPLRSLRAYSCRHVPARRPLRGLHYGRAWRCDHGDLLAAGSRIAGGKDGTAQAMGSAAPADVHNDRPGPSGRLWPPVFDPSRIARSPCVTCPSPSPRPLASSGRRQEDMGQARMGRRQGMAAPGENLQNSAEACPRNTMIRARFCIRRAYPDMFEQTSGRR